MKKYRVRFAPSPTGEMHVGSARTALFDFLIARKSEGSFVLRIEDTDQERLVPGTVERIMDALSWLGLKPDEGPSQGGPYAPYVQSERLPLYQDAAQELINSGAAYECFCTPERLASLREQQVAANQPPRYDRLCLRLSKGEIGQRMSEGTPHVVRLRVPEQGSVSFIDRIRGEITFAYAELDDAVLLKSDGFPTYHLAVVVDDHAMDINLVIRAEEWISSTPKHLLLYSAFGWEPPEYAHAPQILAKDRSKLSKRHGAVSVQEFREKGYLPEALVNYLALLGWNPGDDREVFSLEELAEVFTLERVMKAGAIFDEEKLKWLNGKYIRAFSPAELVQNLAAHLPAPARELNLEKAVQSIQDRLETLTDAAELMDFYFTAPSMIPEELLIHKKLTKPEVLDGLTFAVAVLERVGDSVQDSAQLKDVVLAEITAAGLSNMQVLWPMRVALTGKKASPDVFDVTVALGVQEAKERIAAAMTQLQR